VGDIRAGLWKLLEYFEDDRIELYNLRDDPGEQHNLAATHAPQANALRQKLHKWREDVGAQMPAVNPKQ
jgi:arylsulfatase A-like enzyme